MGIERKLYKVICVGNLAGGTNGTHEAPFAALVIRGGSTGAEFIAAPSEVRL